MKIGLIVGISVGALATSYFMANSKSINKVIKKSEKMLKHKIMDIMDM